jgi:hypothetical protein
MPPPSRLTWSPKIWSRTGAAVLVGVVGAGLAGCGAPADRPEKTTAAVAPLDGDSTAMPASEGPSGGGEAGEAGAANALAGLNGETLTALNRWRLWGFTAVAAAEFTGANYTEGGVLIGQGLDEVFRDPPPGVDLSDLKAIDKELIDGPPKTPLDSRFAKARADLIANAPVTADTVRRLVEVGLGLYRFVNLADGGGVDPIEYQHSLAAILAAQEALARFKPSAKSPAAFARAEAALAQLRALYPTLRAGDTAVPLQQLAAQASRLELELSGL